ncbi:hypothetical protein [Jiangella alkaliphila]|uniref:DUF4145 domain-containing protein n=2 Tax=Jiangella alkaliphila TaxID=419479 RepID=A0A1H2I2N2_9ACTN|nr:hypothetical protein [Jiangella alkaliphila]SDU38215.1 hypothetical protein SAMN04488563_1391 [Jiangella alkaliphila]
MSWQTAEYSNGGYWKATDAQSLPTIQGRAVAALEFLRRYAGSESEWVRRAQSVYDSHGDRQSIESGARALGPLLREWAAQVAAGVIDVLGARVWAETGLASTDLMEQVRRLNADRGSHPAAAIILCGAAVEIKLRGLVESQGLQMSERPSMGAYYRLLRKADLLTAQDVKDLEQLAGLRNSAAHGQFEALSLERAGLAEQQANIMLRRLDEIENAEA